MTTVATPRRRHTLADLYHERTRFQFIERSWRWAILSGSIILVSLIALAATGLNLGIDFDGGTQWQFRVAAGSPSAADVRDALKPVGLNDAKVLIVGSKEVRVQAKSLSKADQLKVTRTLARFGHIDASTVSVDIVGPTWGDKVSRKALVALLVFFGAIAVYLTFRFEWKMAIAAIIAVLHDIAVTVGVYAITGFEVTPATVVAFLTILGYSLYDTVVVFDKVKENTPTIGTERADTYSAMVNRSMNQVLMRSMNTSIVALLPVGSLLVVGTYVLGGLALRDFALALFVGLLTGAYSSIFVASPLLAAFKEREPRYRALRQRAAADLARAARDTTPPNAVEPRERFTPDVAPDVDVDDRPGVPVGAAPAPARPPGPPGAPSPRSARAPSGPVTPRPRQPRRRKRR
jgi:preprotein translocase subunit SecF